MRPLLLLLLAACGDKPASEIDLDEDGLFADVDCDDEDADVGGPLTWYGDADADGHAGDGLVIEACAAPAGFLAEADDCDDLDPAVNPDAPEVCGGVDDDCDGLIDDADDDVDPATFSTFFLDQDGDGYGDPAVTARACAAPSGHVAEGEDCDDLNPALNPETLWYQDLDRDGYGAPEYFTQSCAQPAGYLADASDCDDLDEAVNPSAAEVCDGGVDNDCDGQADDADPEVDLSTASDWYADADADGYGDPASAPVLACAGPSGTAADATDCDDAVADVNPGAEEVCGDGLDNDCDGGPNACGLPAFVPSTDADLTVTGPSGMNLGWDNAIGDVNGDGHADLITSSYYYAAASGSTYGGLTHVLYGPFTGDLDALADQGAAFQGNDGTDYSGKTLDVGDFDGDGVDDLIVSAYQDDDIASGGGSVFLIYGDAVQPWSGTRSLADGADASWAGTATSDYLGQGLAALGDLDGDGADEWGMGAEGVDDLASNGGVVYVMAGGARRGNLARDPAEAELIIYGNNSSDALGDYRSIAGLGDLDADGLHDFAVSATSADPNGSSSGAVYLAHGQVLSGALIVTAADLDASFRGEASSDYFGEGLAAAGDVDGDGYADFLVGADGNDDAASSAGKVYLFAGGPTRWTGVNEASAATATFTGTSASDYLGEGVAGGDLDGDGFSDPAMGADGLDVSTGSGTLSSVGAAFVFYGPVSGTHSVADADVTLQGTGSSGYLGQDLTVGDLDGDGLMDLVAPAYGVDEVYVLLGAPGL